MNDSQAQKRDKILLAIDRLHKTGASSHTADTLRKQVESDNYIQLAPNAAQLISAYTWHYPHQWHYNQWTRGSGKSTDLGIMLKSIVETMPRGASQFIAPSYTYFLDRIIPAMRDGLEMVGYYEGLHYFIQSAPPKKWQWAKSYKHPSVLKKAVWFFNGHVINLVSQDVAGDGRGLNTDVQMGDESQELSWEMMYENNRPALRGSKGNTLSKSPFFLKRYHYGTVPLNKLGGWVYNLIDLQKEAEVMNTKRERKENILKYLGFTSKVNQDNLPDTYLADARRDAEAKGTIIQYRAEYLNIKPPSVQDGFYALLDEKKHGYRNSYNSYRETLQSGTASSKDDEDCVQNLPLILGVDFGTAINSLVICQHFTTLKEFRVLKSMFVLGLNNEIQQDLFKNFHEYYRYHKEKKIYIWYDATANNDTGDSHRTKAQKMRDQLVGLGWTVILMHNSYAVEKNNPLHQDKYDLFQALLRGEHPGLPKFRINMLNARDLFVSMDNAQVRHTQNGKISKNKSSEARLRSGARQLATDLSDALDYIVHGTLWKDFRYAGGYLPGMRTS